LRNTGWFALVLLLISPASADQFQIPTYSQAEKLFWERVYPDGGWTLYCGERFGGGGRNQVVVEWVYPMQWVMEHLQCGSTEECRAQNAKFNRIEADLHNMYPAKARIVHARKDYRYGIIPGEYREFFECNFEYDVREQLAEPRSIARGNVARSIFYMHIEYGLPIDPRMMDLLQRWNSEDPPSKDELRRNDLLEKLQGTRNPFIDNPQKAKLLLAPKSKQRAGVHYRQAEGTARRSAHPG
jgi:deoxyribonuclease-1